MKKPVFFFASFLYRRLFPLYRQSYFIFKGIQDERIMRLMREGYESGNILDIGANIGFYSEFFSSLITKGKVYCFEPDKENFRKLERYASGGKLVLEQAAASDINGELELFLSPKLNVDHRVYKPEKFTGSYWVKAIRIDDYLQGLPVALVKMDIQGFEFHALQGMEKTLKRNPEVKLFMELWPYGLEKAGSSALEVFGLLTEWGFKVLLIRDGLEELTPETVERLDRNESSYYNVLVAKT